MKVLESKELEDDELYEALRMEITLLRQVCENNASPTGRPPLPQLLRGGSPGLPPRS